MARNYTLTEGSVRAIAKSIDEQGHATKTGSSTSLRRTHNAAETVAYLAMTDGSGVTAMEKTGEELTLGVGTVNLMVIDTEDKLVEIDQTLTVWNSCQSPVSADAVVQIIFCQGRWFVYVEDCG